MCSQKSGRRAQSEIIGAILLIAITLVLASLVAVYVFDVGQQTTGSSTPQVAFSFDNATGTVTITHEGGQPVDASNLDIVVTGGGTVSSSFSGTVTVGDTATVTGAGSNTVIRVVWTNPDTGQGATLGRWEA